MEMLIPNGPKWRHEGYWHNVHILLFPLKKFGHPGNTLFRSLDIPGLTRSLHGKGVMALNNEFQFSSSSVR